MRRLATFALGFGLWDLAYYGMLWLALGWPTGWLEWDILFLIPAPWAAPVLAPVLVSFALVGCGSLVLWRRGEDAPLRFGRRDWLVLAASGALTLATFFWNTPRVARLETPTSYPWGPFLVGWLGGIACFARGWRRR